MNNEAFDNWKQAYEERMKQLEAAEKDAVEARVMAHHLAEALKDYLADLKTRAHAKEVLAFYNEKFG